MKKKCILVFLLLFACCSCAIKPFVDTRREAGSNETFGLSTQDYPAICYNALTTRPQKVINLAYKECAKTNRRPVFYRQTKFTCRLTVPHHAIYKCVQ